MQHVFVIGGSTYDHIVHLQHLPQGVPQTIHYAPLHEGCGSTGIGKALALTKLQVPTTLYTAFGNDYYGQHIRDFLAAQQLNTITTIDPAGTERHINLMDTAGNRISMFVTQSSETLTHPYNIIQQQLDATDVVVLNIITYCKQLIPLVKASNKPVWTDLHDYDGSNTYHQPFIEAAQYIHMSSDNCLHYRNVMEQLIAQGKQLVICTHSKAGATLLTPYGKWIEQPAISNAPIVDSNGAGDSFFAGFLYGWLQQLPLETCMQMGAICGAWAVTDLSLCYQQLSPTFLQQQLERLCNNEN
ncbi:MAG: carbohydrate kinase family protein [Chitinophagaceae bacterium]